MIPVFYHQDLKTACRIVSACAAGGASVIEFTNRGDFALDIFGELIRFANREHPQIILGIGSIVDAPTAALYIANGANFVVSPAFDEATARLCNRRRIPYSPGCATVTEIQRADEFGCEIIKLFPGKESGGPGFVKAIKGPLPRTAIMPTGGVAPDRESLSEWFEAGVTCVGMGSALLRKDLIAAGDFTTLEQNIRAALELIKEIRAGK